MTLAGTLCVGAEEVCEDGEPNDQNLIAAVTMTYEAATAPSLLAIEATTRLEAGEKLLLDIIQAGINTSHDLLSLPELLRTQNCPYFAIGWHAGSTAAD